MRFYLVLIISAILSISLKSQVKVNYVASDAIFANPERGFYHHTETYSTQYYLLDKSELESYKNEGISLILRVFYLESFTKTDILAEYLENVQADFNTLRSSGLKAIVRFAYTSKYTPPYGDASPDIVLKHINQLKPLLQNNADVIAVIQAGFVGAWGEWFFTDYFAENIDSPSESDWDNRRLVVNALLNALPTNRMIQIRTPKYKMKLINTQQALEKSEAYSGTAAARIGHHNDCFLASPDDYGTYVDSTTEKPYLAQETQFLPMGGETCGIYAPLSECENTMKEMKRFHWSFVNNDYHPDVISGWENEGCYNTIAKSLGYRYRLISAVLSDRSKPKGVFSALIKLKNDGWSNPFNPRKVEIVLKNNVSGELYFLNTSEEPRLWPLNDTIEITAEAGIPSFVEPGTYSIYLNLPDPASTLSNNPEYSIRLANQNTWESTTGYNKLYSTLNIDFSNTDISNYTGSTFFTGKNSKPSEMQPEITVDGVSNDWKGIQPEYLTVGQRMLEIRSAVNRDTLFYLIKGNDLHQGTQLYLNADNQNTGYNAWQWAENGVDYLLENNNFYSYSGVNHNWGWTFINSISKVETDSVIEIAIPMAYLNQVSLSNTFSYAATNDYSDADSTNYLPLFGENFISSKRPLELNSPIKATYYNGNAIVYWAEDTASFYRVLERKKEGEDNYSTVATLSGSTISFLDAGLEKNATYYYREYITNGDNVSYYSEPFEITATNDKFRYTSIAIDGNNGDWNSVVPVSVIKGDTIITLRAFKSPQYLNFFVDGNNLDQYKLYLNSDNSISTGYNPGIWLSEGFDLLISNDSVFCYANGSWDYTQKITDVVRASATIEMKVPLAGLCMQEDINQMSCGLILSGTKTSYLPLYGTDARSFWIYPGPVIPQNFALKNSETYPSSRIIISWETRPENDVYILERATSEAGLFDTIKEFTYVSTDYRDDNLQANTEYFYRMHAFNKCGRSESTQILSLSTGSSGVREQSADDLNVKLVPNVITDVAKFSYHLNKSGFVRVALYNTNGTLVKEVYNGMQESGDQTLTIQKDNLPQGVYCLSLISYDGTVSLKVVIR